jgi:hypothetical protein
VDARLREELQAANNLIGKLSLDLKDALAQKSSSVRNNSYQELEALKLNMKRANKHYSIVCKAVAQLERELKVQGDDNASIQVLSEAKVSHNSIPNSSTNHIPHSIRDRNPKSNL